MRRIKRMLVLPRKQESAEEALEDVRSVIWKAKIQIERIETELIGSETVVWVVSKDEKGAKEALKKNGMESFISGIIVVKLQDKPGELAKVARILSLSGIIVEDAHLIFKSQKLAVYGLKTNRPAETQKIIKKMEAFEKERGEETQSI